MATGSGSGPAAFGLATAAVICAAAFTVWALFAPAYTAGESIVEANPELVARVAVAAPLLVTATVWMLLHVACRFDARWARRAALAVAWLLVAFAWMTGLTIGLFVLPGAVALVAAAALTPVSRS